MVISQLVIYHRARVDLMFLLDQDHVNHSMTDGNKIRGEPDMLFPNKQ